MCQTSAAESGRLQLSARISCDSHKTFKQPQITRKRRQLWSWRGRSIRKVEGLFTFFPPPVIVHHVSFSYHFLVVNLSNRRSSASLIIFLFYIIFCISVPIPASLSPITRSPLSSSVQFRTGDYAVFLSLSIYFLFLLSRTTSFYS